MKPDVLMKALARLDLAKNLKNERVLKGAEEIAKSKSKSDRRRGYDKIFSDAQRGLALEDAVFEVLKGLEQSQNFTVTYATTKDHDILLTMADGREVRVDVKGLFGKSGGGWVSMTEWEYDKADSWTVYLVFDCRLGGAALLGWARGCDFELMKYGPCLPVPRLERQTSFL